MADIDNSPLIKRVLYKSLLLLDSMWVSRNVLRMVYSEAFLSSFS